MADACVTSARWVGCNKGEGSEGQANQRLAGLDGWAVLNIHQMRGLYWKGPLGWSVWRAARSCYPGQVVVRRTDGSQGGEMDGLEAAADQSAGCIVSNR